MVRPQRLRESVAVAAMLAPLWACAQFLPERKYEEILDPPTPVSGHAVVGAVVLTSPKDQQSDTLWVRRGGGLSRIRVDVASANGRLQGEGIWTFKPEPTAGQSWYRLTVPPKSTRPEHLAASVQPADGPSGSTPAFVVAAWGTERPISASKLRLYVNARRAEMFVYLADGKTAVKCTPLENTPTVRFDVVCDVELPAVDPTVVTKLTLVRRDGNSTSRQPLELRW
jgi:hypothetical protein